MTERPPIVSPAGDPSDPLLAWEIVAQVAPLPDILRRHGVTVVQMQAKLRDPIFRSMIAEAKRLWKADTLTTKERIRLKAQLLTEEGLESLADIIKNTDLSPTVRVDAFEKIAKVGSLSTPDQGQAIGERTVININIPGESQPITITSPARPALENIA
jgi:hypothetical protein